MEGLGNDFVFVHENDLAASEEGASVIDALRARGAALARRICDRHFGIGADGLIIVRESQRPDCDIGWMYFNSDGSLSDMCGNGLRCVGLFALQNGLVRSREFAVETAIGAVPVCVADEHTITTDLGQPILASNDIPVGGLRRDQVVLEPLPVKEHTLPVTCVSMGNPHCVIFDSGLTNAEQRVLAPWIQEMQFFPRGVNVEFVDVLSRNHARVFVWERGCGPTLACASGAAAVLVAGALAGKLDRSARIDLPGGTLGVRWDSDGHVRITGPAHIAYKGIFDLNKYLSEDIG
jgi:diaminopimelate epimerase